jgi:parallel beta-helix repeat protein
MIRRLACALLAFCGGTAFAVPCSPELPRDAPADAVDVRRLGARGDGSDDTAALQKALDGLKPGQWLVFPRGTYHHNKRLVVSRPGVTLVGQCATLHATDPAEQALLVQASGVRVRQLTFTAVTDKRRSAAWQSRIAVWRAGGPSIPPLTDIEIRDNRVLDSGPPGSPQANSSSAAGIFVHNVKGFVVVGNEVRRSLADGIHISGGASDGQVTGNTVRESGDDMVAIVSYLDQQRPVRNVLIADNDLAGQYWGRGIAIVGAEGVRVERNRIEAATRAAAIYVARESGYKTFGVRDVRIAGNRIAHVQTTEPQYDARGGGRRTGHAAIEIVAQGGGAGDAPPESLAIRGVTVEDNDIEDVANAGIRVGNGSGRGIGALAAGAAGGAPPVQGVTVRGNRLRGVRGPPVQVLNGDDPQALQACEGNTAEGRSTGCGR